jgi:hypothetical protein
MIVTYVCTVIDRRTDKELASYEIEIDPKYEHEDHARRYAAAMFRKEALNFKQEADWFIRSTRSSNAQS